MLVRIANREDPDQTASGRQSIYRNLLNLCNPLMFIQVNKSAYGPGLMNLLE